MPSPNLITVAGITGPGNTLASKQYNDITDVNINFGKQVLTLTRGSLGKIEVDLYGVTTVTYTISNHVATVSFT